MEELYPDTCRPEPGSEAAGSKEEEEEKKNIKKLARYTGSLVQAGCHLLIVVDAVNQVKHLL